MVSLPRSAQEERIPKAPAFMHRHTLITSFPRGGKFQINTYSTRDQAAPAVISDADGNIVPVWVSDGSGGTGTEGTINQMQRVDAITTPGKAEIFLPIVRRDVASAAAEPATALSAENGHLLTWWPGGSLGRRGCILGGGAAPAVAFTTARGLQANPVRRLEQRVT
jgi:hypothetical protein